MLLFHKINVYSLSRIFYGHIFNRSTLTPHSDSLTLLAQEHHNSVSICKHAFTHTQIYPPANTGDAGDVG